MKSYRVEFDRVGRHRSVAPLEVKARDAEHLEDQIRKYVKGKLASRFYDVTVDLAEGVGWITAGAIHSAGEFKIIEQKEG